MTFKELRLRSKQTVSEVSKKLKIKEETYRKYEYSMRLPSGLILTQMAEIFQCSGDDVLKAYKHHKEVQIERYGKTNP